MHCPHCVVSELARLRALRRFQLESRIHVVRLRRTVAAATAAAAATATHGCVVSRSRQAAQRNDLRRARPRRRSGDAAAVTGLRRTCHEATMWGVSLFGSVVDEYDTARPSYPPALYAELGPLRGRR